MKRLLLSLALVAAAGPATACFADYRAQMDNPLRFHYGVIDLPSNACSPQAARNYISRRIASEGWTLVNLGSVFDRDGLTQRRMADAGAYYLRF